MVTKRRISWTSYYLAGRLSPSGRFCLAYRDRWRRVANPDGRRVDLFPYRNVWFGAWLAQGDVASEVARVKAGPGDGVVSAGGAGFVATLIQLDLVDEYRMFMNPIVPGGGTPHLPRLDHRLSLELLETRTFGSRVVYLRYQRPAR
jgi:dihydrofolate reductase